MIFGTVAAIFMMFLTFPFWVIASFSWGFIFALLTLAQMMTDFFEADPLKWELIWAVPVVTLVEGFMAAWSVPSAMWKWGFDHPWLAILTGVTSFWLLSVLGRNE